MSKLVKNIFLLSALFLGACGLNNETQTKRELEQELELLRSQGIGEKHPEVLKRKLLIKK